MNIYHFKHNRNTILDLFWSLTSEHEMARETKIHVPSFQVKFAINEAHIVHVQKVLYQSVCETFFIYGPYGLIPLKGGQYRSYILLHW